MTHVTALFHVNIPPPPGDSGAFSPCNRVTISARRESRDRIETRRYRNAPRERSRPYRLPAEARSRGIRGRGRVQESRHAATKRARVSLRCTRSPPLCPLLLPRESRDRPRSALLAERKKTPHRNGEPPPTSTSSSALPQRIAGVSQFRGLLCHLRFRAALSRARLAAQRDRARSRIRIRDLHSYRSAAVSACN